MAAVVGSVLDERFGDPAVTQLVVTSDGFVLAQAESEVLPTTCSAPRRT